MDSIQAQPDTARQLYNQSLDQLGGALKNIVIHAHPDTLHHLQAQFGDSNELSGMRLAPDTSMALGGFKLVHADGEHDCSLETRWKNVIASLGRQDPLSPPASENPEPEPDA